MPADSVQLECLNGLHGDCLIVHFKKGAKSGMILLDGGPNGVYGATLKTRLEQLAQKSDGVAKFTLGVVTHIDDDHINGLLALTDDLVEQKSRAQLQTVQFKAFWHNSFEKLAEPGKTSTTTASVTASVLAGFQTGRLTKFKDARTSEVLASVNQGQRLSRNLGTLNLAGNIPFHGLVKGFTEYTIPNGPKLSVVGPSEKRLEKLRKEYEKALGGPVTPASLAAYVDKSVPNLSSIVFLLEHAGKRMLFTGDARGDDILEYLKDAHKLDADGKIELDLFKMPHHGSDRNIARDFFDQVRAKTYVIPADGKYDNPDAEVISWLAAACEGRACTVVFTSQPKMEHASKQPKFDKALARLKTVATVKIRKAADLSIMVTV